MKTRKDSRHSIFTMIELLLVIGIIIILACLLLPAINRSRDHAKATLCTSNMKQIYLGFSMYANDYIYYPIAYINEGDGFQHGAWYQKIASYLGDNRIAYTMDIRNQMRVSGPLRCPSAIMPDDNLIMSYAMSPFKYLYQYAPFEMRGVVPLNADNSNDEQKLAYLRPDAARMSAGYLHLSGLVFFADRSNDTNNDKYFGNGDYLCDRDLRHTTTSFRHMRNMKNIAFVDGSIVRLGPSHIMKKTMVGNTAQDLWYRSLYINRQ